MTDPGARFLDRFVMDRSLGRGGFGEVWLAHTDEGERFAIKLQRGDVRTRTALRSFEREGQRAASVVHPNLVRIYESGVHQDRAYVVMEHIDGATLEEELTERKRIGSGVPYELVRRWTVQACAALDALHGGGLIHRDLKPSNVMIFGPNADLKILDLGLAHDAKAQAEELTTLGRVKGTTAYMSPEQARGERVGAPSDAFALTTIVFELLTGLRPWIVDDLGRLLPVGHRILASSNDASTVLRRLSLGPRPLPSAHRLPVELDAVFLAGWAIAPEDRVVPLAGWAARVAQVLERLPADDSGWAGVVRRDKSSVFRARAPALEGLDAETPAKTGIAEAFGTVTRAPEPATRIAPTVAEATALARVEGTVALEVPTHARAGATVALEAATRLRSRPRSRPPVLALVLAAVGLGVTTLAIGMLRARPPAVAPPLVEPSLPVGVVDAPPPPRVPSPSPEPTPSLEPTPVPEPTPSRDPRLPRASLRPKPSPSTVLDPVAPLRARLERGASVEEIARAVRALAAELEPSERAAIDRWVSSAVELDDARPLYLALDAIARARRR